MKYALFIFLFIVINLLTLFLILPHEQQSVNSHMSSGHFAGIVYYSLALIVPVLAHNVIKKLDLKLIFIILSISVSFIYWGYRLYNLYCIPCATSG